MTSGCNTPLDGLVKRLIEMADGASEDTPGFGTGYVIDETDAPFLREAAALLAVSANAETIKMDWPRKSVVQSEIAPLTPAMDNVLAWRLGEIANAAVKESAGDLIDRGLGLLKHLNEREFQVIYTGKKPL